VRLHASRSDHTCLFQVDENGDRDDDDDNVRVSQFIVEARSLKETLVFYIFEREMADTEQKCFFSQIQAPKNNQEGKIQEGKISGTHLSLSRRIGYPKI